MGENNCMNKTKSSKTRKYVNIAGIIIIISIIISAGIIIKRHNTNTAAQKALNNAYIAYSILCSEALTAPDRDTARERITVDKMQQTYGIGYTDDNPAYYKAELSWVDDEYTVTFFEYYDCRLHTAFVYNKAEYGFDIINTGIGEFVINQSEIIIN